MTAPGKKEYQAAIRAVSDLLQHRSALPSPLEASLSQLQRQLTELLCPYSTRELDAHKKMLDERYPDYEHWYIRCGTIVTWCDRRRGCPGDGRRAPGESGKIT